MEDKYIEFENVSKNFGKEEVLTDVNLCLRRGAAYGFIGRNGSGKTVIFKLIVGLIKPTKGRVLIDGVDCSKKGKFVDNAGVMIESPGFIPHYSGIKNLLILNSLSDRPVSREKVKKAMEIVGLNPENKKWVRSYSLGMKQKLGIAQAIMNEPMLLILDEPMNSLDEESVVRMRSYLISQKKDRGVTILVASHNKEDIEILCDELFFIKESKIHDIC